MSRPVGLEELVDALRALPPGDPTEPDILGVLSSCRVDPRELERHVVWSADHYTRHLVFRDDRYQVILLGWGVGQVTPIHDHAGQRCWMMIEQGRLQITDYCWKEGGGAPRLLNAETVGGAPGTMHVDTCACVHRIGNPSDWDEPAISLHIYSRPFSACGIYCAETGEREIVDLEFDSVGPLVPAGAV